jgi:hypothetical protein
VEQWYLQPLGEVTSELHGLRAEADCLRRRAVTGLPSNPDEAVLHVHAKLAAGWHGIEALEEQEPFLAALAKPCSSGTAIPPAANAALRRSSSAVAVW